MDNVLSRDSKVNIKYGQFIFLQKYGLFLWFF